MIFNKKAMPKAITMIISAMALIVLFVIFYGFLTSQTLTKQNNKIGSVVATSNLDEIFAGWLLKNNEIFERPSEGGMTLVGVSKSLTRALKVGGYDVGVEGLKCQSSEQDWSVTCFMYDVTKKDLTMSASPRYSRDVYLPTAQGIRRLRLVGRVKI